MSLWNNQKLVEVLRSGGLVVMPTDTLYGVVGQALKISTVDRLYELRKKKSGKPCIILISSMDDLSSFAIDLSSAQKNEIEKYWPGPVSIILDCLNPDFQYLHRGTNSLAFRLPENKEIRELLKKTGPLIAPSANPEGLTPAKNIKEAKDYFGGLVDLYLDGGEVVGNPSKIIKLENDGNVFVIRP